jgi:hypothetical protein
MKTLHTLTLAAFVLSTASAFARIGETREQIDKRYGAGTHSDYQRLDGAETIKYHFNNFQVEVVFDGGKSIWEIFHRLDRGMDAGDIKMVLKANAGEGHAWHSDRLNHRWNRTGSPQLIGYLWPGHEDFFCIEDVKACDAVQDGEATDPTEGF